MILSHHAAQRWSERCAGLCLAQELATVRRPGKKIRELLRATWHRNQPMAEDLEGRSYLVTQNGVVLVVGCDQVIITVLTMADVKRWERRRKRERRARERCKRGF